MIDDELAGSDYAFHLAFSNIDDNAPDGDGGEAELEIELRVER